MHVLQANEGESGSLQNRRHNTLMQQSIAARARISDALAHYTSMAADLEAAAAAQQASAQVEQPEQAASARQGAQGARLRSNMR